jgi:hypothetical protein
VIADPGNDRRSGEQRLWRAVIASALKEACGNLSAQPGEAPDGGAVERARLWFSLRNPDFCAVCDLAGLNAERVHEQALRLMGARLGAGSTNGS